MKKRLILSVTSDLVTDQRVHKVAQTLYEDGFDVLLIGRKMKQSLPMDQRAYKTRRLTPLFQKTALFYANFNILLFFSLLFKKADVLLSNDLDTLLPNYLVATLKRIPLVYDSHEYFTGVPELQHRPVIRAVWEGIEHFIFPKLKQVYTVNKSIAGLYKKKYNKPVQVVRNVPYLYPGKTAPLTYPAGKKIILYQGSGINVNRGAEELILSMKYLSAAEYCLWVIGGGDVFEQLKRLAAENKLDDRIRFINKVPFSQLRELTVQTHLGISFDKPTNLNYLYSLPNKLFDYLHAGIPILCTPLPEIKAVVDAYKIGCYIDSHEPGHIAERIRFVFNNPEEYLLWKKNAAIASRELCWQQEGKIVSAIFKPYLANIQANKA
ncbi:MAG: glycosyltransferase [Williamsia sp.]|nr:glycosyltransferase [Williamsia sp.]